MAEAQRDAAAAAARQAESDVDRLKAARVLAEKQLARAADWRRRGRSTCGWWTSSRACSTPPGPPSGPPDRRPDGQGPPLAAAAEVEKAKADATVARASLGVAEASRDRLKVNLQYARIVAPFDGVVTHRTFHPGA